MSTDGPRLIAVSNRVAMPRKDGAAAGGLATGILGAMEGRGGVWFGWNGKLTTGQTTDPEIVTQGNVDFATISLNEQDFEQYYNGYSNRVLWPVCHYLLGFVQYSAADFDGYRRVNGEFARKLAMLIKPDDVIWVHDFHLIPLAAELRSAGIKNPIGFFLHVPFPSYEAFRAVPGHDYLLRSMCAYDVVGFHTPGDLAAFETCIREPLVGAEFGDNTTVNVPGGSFVADVFPIGVDTEEIARLSAEAMSDDPVVRLRESLGDRRLLIGVDRLDYSKGLTQRFLAYERVLEKYPNSQNTTVFMQIAPPTRTGVRTYEEIRAELERTTGRINGRFALADWMPIRYLNKGVARKPLMGMFRSANVGLVTPVRDGMNLVAKEYTAAQDPQDPGIVVLSNLAGAAHELREAVLVNPYDQEEVADGVATALSLPRKERQERHAAMMATLKKNDIAAWRTRFVDALLKAAE